MTDQFAYTIVSNPVQLNWVVAKDRKCNFLHLYFVDCLPLPTNKYAHHRKQVADELCRTIKCAMN